MINIDTQIKHWVEGSREEWEVACELIANGRTRHGLFGAHLALEKILKAHVCRHTGDLAPRIHNLARLVELAALDIDQETKNFLFEMNKFNLVGRYPEHQAPIPDLPSAKTIMCRVEEILQCLNKTL